jgi:hypothetical protein
MSALPGPWTVWYTDTETGKDVHVGTYKTTTAADTALYNIFQTDRITERGIANASITHGKFSDR